MKTAYFYFLLFATGFSTYAQQILPAIDSLQLSNKSWVDLDSLRKAHMLNQQFDDAEAIARIQITKTKNQSQDSLFIQSLIQLSGIYTLQRDYAKTIPVLLQAKEKIISYYGKESNVYTSLLNNLGESYLYVGEYQKAASILEGSWSLFQQLARPEVAMEPTILGNLSSAYRLLGKLQEALTYGKQELAIRDTLNGPQSMLTGTTHNNLSLIYRQLGQLDQALVHAKLSLDQIEKSEEYPKQHPFYAIRLNNISSLYKDVKNFEQASMYLEKALEAVKLSQGENSESYPNLLNSLGTLYAYQKKFPQAEETFLKAYDAAKQNLGESHALYGVVLNNLGYVADQQKVYDRSRSYFMESLAFTARSQGTSHENYRFRLNNLITLSTHLQDFEQASKYVMEAEKNQRIQIKNQISMLGEEGGAKLLAFRKSFTTYLSYAFEHHEQYPELRSIPFDNALLLKGLMLENAYALQRDMRLEQDSSIQTLYQAWRNTRKQAAQLQRIPMAGRQQNLADLLLLSDSLESELALRSPKLQSAIEDISWQEVQQHLSEGEVAIEFVHVPFFKHGIPTDSILYGAVLIQSGSSALQLIPLFEEKELDSLLSGSSYNQRRYVNQVYDQKLYTLIWEDLEPFLSDVHTIYYSPSGLLHRISFPAIPLDSTSRLIDHYSLIYTSSTRDLLYEKDGLTSVPESALMYGNIAYDWDTTMSLLAYARGENAIDSSSLQYIPRDNSRGRFWHTLDKTKEELAILKGVFQTENIKPVVLENLNATEESFKSIHQMRPSPDIIHIATHGYFFPDPQLNQKERTSQMLGGQFNFKYAENPLFRSGLILAGANKAWKSKEVLPGREDGILTAFEIANEDLSQTKLVVLSACKTGLGDIRGSEGVYGLQRAFKQAGADYLLLTLWSISDSDETIEFMKVFYEQWFSGLPIPIAFAKTQKIMRDRYADPYFWAGFVLIN